jgi:hypothetical protein
LRVKKYASFIINPGPAQTLVNGTVQEEHRKAFSTGFVTATNQNISNQKTSGIDVLKLLAPRVKEAK